MVTVYAKYAEFVRFFSTPFNLDSVITKIRKNMFIKDISGVFFVGVCLQSEKILQPNCQKTATVN